MRFGKMIVAFAVTVGTTGLLMGCSAGSDQPATGDDDITVVRGGRTITALADKNAGTASIDLKETIKGASLDAVKQLVQDPNLGLWKAIKRPKQIKVGEDSLTIEMAGSPLFTEASLDKNTVKAFMPFAESGLKSHSGLNFELSFSIADDKSGNGFTMTVTNSKPVETRLLGVDVVGANDLKFTFNATKTADGVAIAMHEDVKVKKGDAAKLLGCVIGTADVLDEKFGKGASAQ